MVGRPPPTRHAGFAGSPAPYLPAVAALGVAAACTVAASVVLTFAAASEVFAAADDAVP